MDILDVDVSNSNVDSISMDMGLPLTDTDALHNNFKKKPAGVFIRPSVTSPRCWVTEVYKDYFNGFYQQIRRIPIDEHISNTLLSNDLYV